MIRAGFTTIERQALRTASGGQGAMSDVEALGLELSEARARDGIRATYDAIVQISRR